jgi:hypothetical protein
MDLFLEELNNGIALNDYCITLNNMIFSVNNSFIPLCESFIFSSNRNSELFNLINLLVNISMMTLGYADLVVHTAML